MLQNGFLFAIRCKQLDTGLIDQLKAILIENNKIKLIIIDTLQLVRGQGNRNDTLYGNDYKEISKLKTFADDNHICILLIHHFRKMSDMSDTFNQITGTTGITGAADTMMTLSKEKRFEDKTILSLTGRDIEGGEFMLESDKETHIWQVIGNQDELEIINQKNIYENNPIVLTIKELLEENPMGLKITSNKLYNEILFRRKARPKEGSPGALTRVITRTLQYDLLNYDQIYYNPPSPNGGAGGRNLYFYKVNKKEN